MSASNLTTANPAPARGPSRVGAFHSIVMKAQPDDVNAVPKQRVALRATALVLCLGGALAAAVFVKRNASRHDMASGTPLTKAVEKSPEQILAELPPPTTNSLTDQAITAVIKKVRSKPTEATLWVNLGDALAQKLRDTANQNYYLHAEATYRQALKLDSLNVDALTGMAWVTGGASRVRSEHRVGEQGHRDRAWGCCRSRHHR